MYIALIESLAAYIELCALYIYINDNEYCLIHTLSSAILEKRYWG
jgi:hypothetical protein